MSPKPELFYCAAGNRRFAEIAIRHGFLYGAQLPHVVYYPPAFVDQNWRNPNKEKYIEAVREHKPTMATVLDLEREEQLPEVLEWAEAIAPYVETIIIIPKVMSIIQRLPRTIGETSVRLGYSVPTRYAGTEVPVWEFFGWPVHLLGGSPQKQFELSQYLNVVSADGNYAMKMATQHNQFFAGGSARYAVNRHFPQLQESVFGHVSNDAPYLAFELSCINIKAMWLSCKTAIRWGVVKDIPAIQKIARQHDKALGFVRKASLLRGVEKRELYVAEYNQTIVGFCLWHKRRDGRYVIYDIAVHKHHQRERIGSALLEAVPRPRRLKCTLDNNANEFYEKVGLIQKDIENGRKRKLVLWCDFYNNHQQHSLRPVSGHRDD